MAESEIRTAHQVASALKSNGVSYLFGIPGGGSSIDLIEACHRQDIPFVLVQHETTAAMMAVVVGELTETCGACISIMGPGATNLVSGALYAQLERHALLCFTETYGPAAGPLTSMQNIDHADMFGPLSKASICITASDPAHQIDNAIGIATAERPGAVHIDLPIAPGPGSSSPQTDSALIEPNHPAVVGDLEAIAGAIDRAEKPLLVAGPVVHRQGANHHLLSLAERLQTAVVVTSKARGVIPEDHPLYAGVLCGVYGEGTLEADLISRSDLVVAVGLDRTELLSPWKHRQPLICIDAIPIADEQTVGKPAHTATGPLPELLEALAGQVRARDTWSKAEIADYWTDAMLQLGASSPQMNATNVLVRARQMTPREAILTTDAGVYGRVNLFAWKVYDPSTCFDSSGTNTMGFSIPAGLAGSLVRPEQKTVCLVGDAGFLMRCGELETAVRMKLTPVIVVFNDATLGMIRIKQRQKEYAREGVDLAQTDFARLAESFGAVGSEVHTLGEFETAFGAALQSDRLHVIDVRVDPDVYAGHIRPIRG